MIPLSLRKLIMILLCFIVIPAFSAVSLTNEAASLTTTNTNIVVNLIHPSTNIPGTASFNVDVSGGAFFPVFNLASGMAIGWSGGIHTFWSLTKILPGDFQLLPEMILNSIDVGLSIFTVSGTGSTGRNSSIYFLNALLNLYYRLPFNINKDLNVIAGLGFGIASVSSTVNPGQNPVTASSIDPVLYPQIGVRYQLLKHLYVRADVGYYIDFETVTGMGIMTTLGVGYAY